MSKPSLGRHTRGPWTAQKWGGETIIQAAIPEDGGRVIIREIAKMTSTINTLGDTRLVAGAPELFEELTQLCGIIGWRDPRCLRAIELLARIEGDA